MRSSTSSPRICSGGTIRPENYGKITALALDPVEKKLILLGSGTPPEEISLNLDLILDLEGITEDGSD